MHAEQNLTQDQPFLREDLALLTSAQNTASMKEKAAMHARKALDLGISENNSSVERVQKLQALLEQSNV